MQADASRQVDSEVTRDRAVLSALAHLGCATLPQLHTLCFPHAARSTVRTTLRYLNEAGWLRHSPWRVQGRMSNRGHMYTITQKGMAFVHHVPSLAVIGPMDLGRPSTPHEHVMWQSRADIRSLVTRLIVEARQHPCLADVQIVFPQISWLAWPWNTSAEPDALLSIVWHRPMVKVDDWLPWTMPRQHLESAFHYPIYLEGPAQTSRTFSVDWFVEVWNACPADHMCIPVFVSITDEDSVRAQEHIFSAYQQHPVRLASWSALQRRIVNGEWRDESGQRCTLHP